MARFFKVRNFEKFQHYKDRSPPWIKLYNETLENYEFGSLNDATKGQLIGIWLLASRTDNKLPFDPKWIASKINATDPVDLEALYAANFITDLDEADTAEQDATPAQRKAKENGFGSRHIPDVTKREAWNRDGGTCRKCGSSENIEYDHIHPVSKGGNSELENIQLLCRPCNRAKRVSVATPAQPPTSDKRSLEREGQVQGEEKEKSPTPAKPQARANDDFDRFKAVYPRRDGSNPWQPAEKKFKALVKTGVDPETMIRAATELAREEGARGNIGTKFIPQALTWLNQQRFHDYAAQSFSSSSEIVGFYAKADSQQLEAWDQHNLSSKGKRLPRDTRGGWLVSSEWPPGYVPASSSSIEVPGLRRMDA